MFSPSNTMATGHVFAALEEVLVFVQTFGTISIALV